MCLISHVNVVQKAGWLYRPARRHEGISGEEIRTLRCLSISPKDLTRQTQSHGFIEARENRSSWVGRKTGCVRHRMGLFNGECPVVSQP